MEMAAEVLCQGCALEPRRKGAAGAAGGDVERPGQHRSVELPLGWHRERSPARASRCPGLAFVSSHSKQWDSTGDKRPWMR